MPAFASASSGLARAFGALVLTLIAPSCLAAALTVSPGSGRQGTSVAVSGSGLAAGASYDLEFIGSSTIEIARLASDARGAINTTRVLPALPPGGGKMVLRTPPTNFPPSPGTIVASTAFKALAPMSFTPSTSTIHAGQTLGFSVGNLSTGYLTILYEGKAVLGPVAVSAGSYSGKFLVPTDRPAPLPADADIRLVNAIGRSVVGTLDVVLPVRARLASPFRIGISTPPPTQVKPSQGFRVTGTFELEANEASPDAVSLWYFGDDGAVFPLGAGSATSANGQLQYDFNGMAGGTRAMTAGPVASGRTAFVAESESSTGGRNQIVQQPGNAAFEALPDDRWRIRVRLLKPDGQPIAGGVVQFEGAPVAEPDPGMPEIRYRSARDYVATSSVASQLVRYRATDDQGCPLTLARQLTDSQGFATFEFTDDELHLHAPKRIPTNPGQTTVIGIQLIGIDASAQGYGFQFPNGHPDAGDFLPHIYEVQFGGVGDGDPTGDTITFVDYYQDVTTGSGTRDYTYTLTLPQIQPGVVLFDTAVVPWIAHTETGAQESSSGPFPPKNLAFGPINSKRNIAPTWIQPSSSAFPTQVTVRTDPAVSGAIASAKLYLDVNRNGTPGFVGDFTPSGTPLDCSINGLDSSLTWRANFPSVEQQAAGRIKGYVEFIGQNSNNRAKQRIAIDMRENDLAWLAHSRYSDRKVYFQGGGQTFAVDAIEDTEDAEVELGRDPGYDIGRLRNATANTRVIDINVDASGHRTVVAPLDGQHREAGRPGAPTLLEPAPGVAFSEHYTLLDQSFPLFYYVWGVPVLAGIELGADFSILADIDINGEFIVEAATLEPSLDVTTTPSMELGLNFYVDIDVLFDLVDGGVDLDAIFGLEMPVRVIDNEPQAARSCFTASLIFSWHFEVFCLPLDFVCDAINDIEGSETLLQDSTGNGCPAQQQGLFADAKGTPARPSARIRPNHAVVAYSTAGAGLMAFTRDDSRGSAPPVLVARPVDGGEFQRTADDTVLSSQPGIRSIDIAFYDDHQAMMVWAENADDYPTLAAKRPAQRLARQRLMWSRWDGERWTAKAALTPPSGGEGGVDLAPCTGRIACPTGGSVLAVWTRDVAGSLTQHRTRVYWSRYDGGSRGWTSPQPVDGSASALIDSAPSALFVGGEPLVVFVRSTSGVFGDTDARRVAYRFVGNAGNAVQVPANLPGGVAWPSAVALPGGGFALVHTHANDPKAFVGNTQRVALGYASACASGACTMTAQAVTDAYGRPVYGERPTAVLDDSGSVTVVMRGVGFGANGSGINTRPDDPIGMALHTGDIVSFQHMQGRTTIAPVALTNDGRGHFAPNVAMDPATGQAVVASTIGAELPGSLRAQYAKSGAKEPPARAKAVLAEPDLEVIGVAQGVDFAIENIVPLAPLVAGSTVTVRAVVRNLGTSYTEQTAPWLVNFGWDAPYDAGGALAGSAEVPALLRPGESRFVSVSVVVPTGFTPDEPHALFATLVRNGSAVDDVHGANDGKVYRFGGMPKPFGLNATAIPGADVVQLTWEPIADPNDLIAGFRVWCHDGDGAWRHLGSSFEHGFIDLLPIPDTKRHYRVTSYSRNAIESEPSDVAAATVVDLPDAPPPDRPDALFADGYE